MSEVYVLWVRHCESCANTSFNISNKINLLQRLKHKMSKEPLCTLKGYNQSMEMGKQIHDWYIREGKKRVGPKIKIYTSILPRAMETGKLLSNSFRRYIRKIEPICYVSEIIKQYDLIFPKGSQSTTNYEKVICHINALNKIFKNYGSKIVYKKQGCVEEDLCTHNFKQKCVKCKSKCCLCLQEGKCKLDHKCDYQNFKNNYLGKIIKPNTLNIIVSHGGYIMRNLNISSHPQNTQSYLVKYTKQDDKWMQEVLDIDFIPKELKEIKTPNNIDIKYLNCTYTYNKDIKCK